MNTDPVMHYEDRPGHAACGRSLPSAGFYTDDIVLIEERAGSRCKACWRVLKARGDVDVEIGES